MKLRILFFLCLVALGMLPAQQGTGSAGAPAASTGAPGEGTCAMPGCHVDFALNSGGGLFELKQTVTAGGFLVSLKLKQSQQKTAGFELTAIDGGGNAAGQFYLTDAARTQLITGQGKHAGRMYATYTAAGTGLNAYGDGEWQIKWMPGNVSGPVSFYAAATAGNGDGTQAGDQVYALSQTTAEWLAAKTNIEKPCLMTVAGNTLVATEPCLVNIYSLNGQQAAPQFMLCGSHTLQTLASGVYVAHASKGGNTQVLKMMLP